MKRIIIQKSPVEFYMAVEDRLHDEKHPVYKIEGPMFPSPELVAQDIRYFNYHDKAKRE